MIMISVIFPEHVVCWISTGFWCPDVLKIHVILFSLKVEILYGCACDIIAIGRYDCCNFFECC